jgi:hypothetical protein
MLSARSRRNISLRCPDVQRTTPGVRGKDHDGSYLTVARQRTIEVELEHVRHELPDPFQLPSGLERVFDDPVAQRLVTGGDASVRRIMGFLQGCRDPALARVAVLVLSRFPPDRFYQELLSVLGRADQSMSEAIGTGLWLIRSPEGQIARDLVEVAAAYGNPNPLLLLQRPIAKEVRDNLAAVIRQRRMPWSLYALYSYRYALEPDDVPLLTLVSGWTDRPELASLAGLCLLRLGSKNGLDGIQAGLGAPSEEVRTLTFYELSRFLPEAVLRQSGYDPASAAGETQPAISFLVDLLS